jgi:hypothetical protein
MKWLMVPIGYEVGSTSELPGLYGKGNNLVLAESSTPVTQSVTRSYTD